MTTWTKEREEKLRSLWLANKTGSEIAQALNITRNAVLGKRFRMKLPNRESPLPSKHREAIKKGRRKSPIRPVERKPRVPLYHTPQEENRAVRPIEYVYGRTCQWLHGEPSDLNYCGKPGFPYCPEHRDICYVREV